jgi:hypothetical protein
MNLRVSFVFSIALCTTISRAGLATFSPASQDVTPGTIATMDITLTAQQLPDFNSADVIIGSPDANISPAAWAYSQQFLNLSSGPVQDPGNCDPGPCNPSFIYVGGITLLSNGSYGSSIVLGTLRVDTTGFAPGTYNYLIDSSSDGISAIGRHGATEPLSGQGVIHVVPEPTCALILSLGAAAMILKKRGTQ